MARQFVISTFLTATLLANTAAAGGASPVKVQNLPIKTKIVAALQAHIGKVALMKDHEEWHEYKEALEQEATLVLGIADRQKSVCDDLNRMNRADLLGFSTEIEIAAKVGSVCAKNLMAEMDTFVVEKVKKIEEKRTQQASGLTKCSDTKDHDRFLGPSKVYQLHQRQIKKRLVVGPMQDCEINFTFDDGPHPTRTQTLLRTLGDEKVSANFFVIGKNVERYPKLVQATAEAGHIVGAHSQTHRQLSKLPFKDAVMDIEESFDAIFDAIGVVSNFFRFPYGSGTKDLRDYLYETGRVEFFWNMDTLDWKIRDPEKLYTHVISEIERERKGIILFHDVHTQTIAIMPNLLEALHEAGYQTTLLVPADNGHDLP